MSEESPRGCEKSPKDVKEDDADSEGDRARRVQTTEWHNKLAVRRCKNFSSYRLNREPNILILMA